LKAPRQIEIHPKRIRRAFEVAHKLPDLSVEALDKFKSLATSFAYSFVDRGNFDEQVKGFQSKPL
jgi:hypothetical protein